MRRWSSRSIFKFLPLIAGAALLVFSPSVGAWPKVRAKGSCLKCHANVMRGILKHDAAVLDCRYCHNNAGPGAKTTLKAPVIELCAQCHDLKGLNIEECSSRGGKCGHFVADHPVEGPRDPLFPETKEFNCISCHNPHSSNQPKLFRYKYPLNQVGGSCVVCHWQQTGLPVPPAPAWDEFANQDGGSR